MKMISFSMACMLLIACQQRASSDQVKESVVQTEKAFAKMAKDAGIAAAFYAFADTTAVIKRQNDTLIQGREAIRAFYANSIPGTEVAWLPDFVDVSTDGSMAYTYGKYVWRIPRKDSGFTEYKGVFHTVWKKQTDGSWKYVWD